MAIVPSGKDRILVKMFEPKTKTEGGIHIPDQAQEDKAEGVVEALPKEPFEKQNEIKIGDEVIFGKYSGETITINKTKYRIMNVNEVLAIRDG